jgi:UDP:flavonoid glycosyltransferase YjiC (YdhE family)
LRVLVYTSPARGHLYPVVPIVQELQRRGHELALCTLASQVETVRALGIDAKPVSKQIEQIELDDYKASSVPAKGRRALATFAARAEHEAVDLERAIGERDPELLVIDVNCWGAATVAEASGRPWVVFSPFLLMLPSRDAPAYGLGLAPPRGPLGRGRDSVLRRIWNVNIDRAVMPGLNALRARHSLPGLDHFTDLLARSPLLLAMTAEGFEYPRSDWPANVRLVGAINWDPPAPCASLSTPATDSAPYPNSAAFLRPHAAASSPSHTTLTPRSPSPSPPWLAEMQDPLVLVTCSTELQHDRRLIRVALEALPPTGMSVLATTAAHDPDEFKAPAGSRVERFVPHEVILERAACVVCHGGMGITQKALSAGVPVVVVPFGRDQLETASRVKVAQAGVRLSPRHLTPERLADAVRAALGCRAGAQRVSRAYRAAGGPTAAADAIETLGGIHQLFTG